MKRQHITAFYLEALLLIAVFVAMILVLTQVFGLSKEQSMQAKQLTNAVCLASNAAEAMATAENPEELAALLDEGGNVRLTEHGIEAGYGPDMSPSGSQVAALRLTVDWLPSQDEPQFVKGFIAVYREDGETPIYTLETAVCIKEAGA